MNKEFIDLVNENITTLERFVPVVNKVHGPSHPEFNEVKSVFDLMNEKIINNDYELLKEFNLLKEVTNNYIIPTDVCETYEAVYNILKKLDNSIRG